jgi:FtsH-binding integral membrane protein
MANVASWVAGVLGVVGVLGAWAGIAAWLTGDAERRGYTGVAPFFLFWMGGPFAVPLWFLIRPRTTLTDRLVQDFAGADDMLATASKLDRLGDWDAAAALYRDAAARYPEHANYALACLGAIDAKRAAGRRGP